MPYAKLDRKDRLYLPRSVREAIGLGEGDIVASTIVDGELRVRKADDPYAGYDAAARRAAEWADAHPEQ